MYIHKLAGSWVRHPFWRGSFLLTEPQDLSAIRECGVGEVLSLIHISEPTR
ncbi:DUF3391 domain-containing protein, partial [Pseudomonas sp. CCI1.1]